MITASGYPDLLYSNFLKIDNFIYLNIYKAAAGLSWGMWTFRCGMWDLVPCKGLQPGPLHAEHRVLATGPPAVLEFNSMCMLSHSGMSDSSWHHGHSPSDSCVHGVIPAKLLEWVAISSSRESSHSRDRTCLVRLLRWQMDSLPLSHLGSPF